MDSVNQSSKISLKPDNLTQEQKLRLKKFIIENGKIVPNPSYDPAFAESFSKGLFEQAVHEKIDLLKEDKRGLYSKGQVKTVAQPKTREDAVEASKEINEIYRRLDMIKDPARRMAKARQYYADNHAPKPWVYSEKARQCSRAKQKARAKVTPVFADTGVSEENLVSVIEDARNRKGKDKLTMNSIYSVFVELFNIGRRGSFLQVSISHLSKKLGLDDRTINRALAFLENANLIKRLTAHLCTNIYQLTIHVLSSKVQSLLAAFSIGRQAFLLRDVVQKSRVELLNQVDTSNNKSQVGESIPKRSGFDKNLDYLDALKSYFIKKGIILPTSIAST